MATPEEKENLMNIANEQELSEEVKNKMVLEFDESAEETQLTLEELFHLGQKYFKDHSSEEEISHSDRLKLKSFIKQAKHGKYQSNVISDCVYSETIGDQRIHYWESLGDMSQEDAMKNFLDALISFMPDFITYVRSNNLNSEENIGSENSSDDERQEYEMLLKREEMRLRDAKMKKRIKDCLDQQTAIQYRQYAKQQVPDNETEQEALIEQLQEQHYEQYIDQVHNQQLIHQRQQYYQIQLALKSQQHQPSFLNVNNNNNNNNNDNDNDNSNNNNTLGSYSIIRNDKNDDGDANSSQQSKLTTTTSSSPATKTTSSSSSAAATSVANDTDDVNSDNNIATNDGDDEDDDVDNDGLIVDDNFMMHNMPPLIPASLWTRSDIKEFKDSIRKSPENCIKVGSLSTATVKVPTHEDGTRIFWEFATDYYDLGFGVYFEWTLNPQPDVTVQVCESSDEEDAEEDAETVSTDKGDIEKGTRTRKEGPPMDEIIQIHRRDCHEEVYCGSHIYPGRGLYHLKFDNSYSLWRSKTVYFKVFYSK